MIVYRTFYILMLIGFSYCSLNASNLKMNIIGILLTIVNAMLFWK